MVAYMTHLETLENGLTTVKLIGKLLREKITIEGLFTTVLRTGCSEGKYYFYTQNSGKDTVKSPMDMFPTYAIHNDLKYVVDKICNYYEIGEYKSDAEMSQEDAAVATDIEKPDANGRRSRSGRNKDAAQRSTRRTHDEVVAENQQKSAEYMEKCSEAVDNVADGREEVPFEEAAAAMDTVPVPELETPPRRTRKERVAAAAEQPKVCSEDTYFYIPADDNYVMRHAGDPIPEGSQVITKEEFTEGAKRIAQENNPVEGAVNPTEQTAEAPRTRRTRRTR